MLNAVPPVPEGNLSNARATSGARGNNNNNRRNGRRGQVAAGVAPRTLFEGTDPNMKGFVYDVPNGMNHDQFSKTTKQMAIAMASDMGIVHG